MSQPPAADGASLRAAGRDIGTPFQVRLHWNSRSAEVTCTRALRILPGKRLVCAGEKAGQRIVAKFFLDRNKAERHCSREEQGIAALQEAGIHAPEILLRGRLHPGKEPVLVFREIQPAVAFPEAWYQAETDTARRELLKHLASVTAAMHRAGLVHNDAHPGNFMLCGSLMYAVDGAAVWSANQGGPLSRRKSLKNLGAFFAQFPAGLDHLLRDGFREYAEKRGWNQAEALYRGIARQIRLQRKKREQKHLKKIYRESSARVCQRSPGWFLVCDRRLYTRNMARFLAAPEPFMESGKLLKDGNSSTVALVEVDQRPLVVKRYNMKSPWHRLSRCARPSRAWHSWKNAHRLGLMEVATPRPIAILEKRWGPLRSRAYFITEYTPGTDAWHRLHAGTAGAAGQRELVEQFGGLLQKFHDARITHGDLKATNFILPEGGGGLMVTDLDAMHAHRGATRRFRRKFCKDCRRLLQNWTDLPETHALFVRELKSRGLLDYANSSNAAAIRSNTASTQ